MLINPFAKFLLEQKRYDEASALAGEIAEVALRTLGPEHFNTRAFVENAARILDAWEVADPGKGHGTAASQWRGRLSASSASTQNTDAVR
jgi:hypothetical protein